MINVVVLTGRLTRDPELKYTQSGKAFARVTLAVNRAFSKDEADFINIVAWEKKAEVVGEYCRKGMMVGIQGRLNVRNYEDENKQKKTITEIIADSIEFLDTKKSGKASGNEESSNEKEIDDSDFPF